MRSDEPGFRNPLPTGMLMGHQDGLTAPGSAGVADRPPGVGGGPIVGTPVVSTPYASSQVGANMPVVPVAAGDTAGMADDQGAHASAITAGTAAQFMDTGAGSGHVVGDQHPGGH